MTSHSPTRQLISRVSGLRFDTLPDDVKEVATHCFRDWASVTVAGSTEPVAQLLRDEMSERGGHPQATAVGSQALFTAHDAALCNGTAAHALDFDDVLETMLGHPTAPILSAALAAGEKTGASGRSVLTAFVAGVETASGVGRVMEPGHHEAGWHTTGTLGTFGATAAVAHLLHLDETQWNNAFGLAAAQAAGVKANFGTMAKPFHAGRAAANGVLAASLAARGMTAAQDAIEAPQGYAGAATPTYHPDAFESVTSDTFDVRDVLFKRHASCYYTHSLIEGMLRIRPLIRFDTAQVTRMRLHVTPNHLTTCGLETARTALEGKFNMYFLAGLALVAGNAGEQEFAESWLTNPEVLRLASVTDVVADHDGPQMATPCEVYTADGDVHHVCVDLGVPARGEELAEQRLGLVSKFHSLVDPVIGSSAAARLSTAIDDIASFDDVGTVLALTRIPSGAVL